jgi:plasmid stabilization system protein ParE
MKLRYLTVAEVEATEAAEYYENQNAGLGAECVDELKRAERRIAQHPSAWARNSQLTRSCLMSRFPFSVIYRVAMDEIVIVALHPHSRDPRRWQDRIFE